MPHAAAPTPTVPPPAPQAAPSHARRATSATATGRALTGLHSPGAVPPGRPVAECRACGAGIVFVRHEDTGRRMPLDAAPVRVETPEFYAVAGGTDGFPSGPPASLVVVSRLGFGRVVTAPVPGTVGHVVHFATCTNLPHVSAADRAVALHQTDLFE